MLRRIEAFTFEPRAERDLARLDPPAARRVIAALDRLLERDPSLDLRRQSSLRPFSRLSGCSPTGRHSRSSDSNGSASSSSSIARLATIPGSRSSSRSQASLAARSRWPTGRPEPLERHDFECGEPALVEWLKRHAGSAHASGSARVFVTTLEDRKTVVGYYALAAAQVAPEAATVRALKGQPRYEAGAGGHSCFDVNSGGVLVGDATCRVGPNRSGRLNCVCRRGRPTARRPSASARRTRPPTHYLPTGGECPLADRLLGRHLVCRRPPAVARRERLHVERQVCDLGDAQCLGWLAREPAACSRSGRCGAGPYESCFHAQGRDSSANRLICAAMTASAPTSFDSDQVTPIHLSLPECSESRRRRARRVRPARQAVDAGVPARRTPRVALVGPASTARRWWMSSAIAPFTRQK